MEGTKFAAETERLDAMIEADEERFAKHTDLRED
jgi:hypothetical protein